MALFDATELATVRITRMVLHKVGPQETDFTLFNGIIAPVPLEDFFLARLADANKGSAYTFRDDSNLLAALQRNASNGAVLEAVGKDIACSFNGLHQGRHAKAGTLAIFELTSPTRSLYAIVKFDNVRGVAVSADADVHAHLSLLGNTIMESKDAMQKSALVRLSTDGGALAVRDRRTSRKIPDYFEQFLGATRLFSEKELTTRLNDALRATAAERRDIIEERVLADLPMRIYSAIQAAEAFDPDDDTVLTAVFGAVPEDSLIRETFAQQLANRDMEHEEFALAKNAVARPTRRRITTNEGIVLTYGTQFEDNVKIESDPATDTTTITIRTQGIKDREQLP